MREQDSPSTDRGQAYTLEGLIGAMVVLMAVLFALQSVVITPTSSGLSDRSVQAQIQQEAQDALVVSDQDGNLSETIRNWNTSDDGHFYKASVSGPSGETYNTSEFKNQSELGDILKQRFADNGYNYNVELVYENESEFNTTHVVYQGTPSPNAVTASYVVTLYQDQTLTAESNDDDDITLPKAHDKNYPIPEADDTKVVHKVVEVRVIVW